MCNSWSNAVQIDEITRLLMFQASAKMHPVRAGATSGDLGLRSGATCRARWRVFRCSGLCLKFCIRLYPVCIRWCCLRLLISISVCVCPLMLFSCGRVCMPFISVFVWSNQRPSLTLVVHWFLPISVLVHCYYYWLFKVGRI